MLWMPSISPLQFQIAADTSGPKVAHLSTFRAKFRSLQNRLIRTNLCTLTSSFALSHHATKAALKTSTYQKSGGECKAVIVWRCSQTSHFSPARCVSYFLCPAIAATAQDGPAALALHPRQTPELGSRITNCNAITCDNFQTPTQVKLVQGYLMRMQSRGPAPPDSTAEPSR